MCSFRSMRIGLYPVSVRLTERSAVCRISASKRMPGLDLNWMEPFRSFSDGDAHEHLARPCSLSSWTSCQVDYFHADRRPVWRRSPGPDVSCAGNTGPWPSPSSTGKACATSRPASRSTHRNSITWASASRSGATLADANERRDWRIHAAMAQRLITQARTLRDEELGLDLTRYRLWTRRPSLCACRSFRDRTKGGGEDAAARCQHQVLSTSRMASCTTFMPSICSCRKPEPSTSWIVATSTLPAFMCCAKPGPSSSRVPSRTSMLIASIPPTDRSTTSFATRPSPWTFYTRQDYPELLRRIPLRTPSGKTLVFITNNFSLPAATICALYKSRWQVELFFKWIKQHLRIKQFYGTLRTR